LCFIQQATIIAVALWVFRTKNCHGMILWFAALTSLGYCINPPPELAVLVLVVNFQS
jgi:hypothetical protein